MNLVKKNLFLGKNLNLKKKDFFRESLKIEYKKKKQKKQNKKDIFCSRYLILLKRKLKNTKSTGRHAAAYYLTKSMDRVRPLLDLQRVRRKGRTYYIPYEIKEEKARIQALKWIKEGSQKTSKGKNQSIARALAFLFLESMKGEGYVQKKQKEHHTLASINKSYIRFRWW